ncbi:hypothetical protein [Cohnella sp. REN36]|uniref:hypothetical protein n=1 Tax=Cohnella sp. REN36 TaxID=2887347 RepID=UPI001D14F67A|nr:hypothetical protein [Cohnella sp. REN36]MCC3375986.1 hypothetical protein [Cohnella sp. REN36]
MYELVRTPRQQKQFRRTWEYFCQKNNWYNDPYAANGIRYHLIRPRVSLWSRRKVIGTIEFIPYDPSNPYSTVEGPHKCRFSEYEDVRQHQERTWEIDKLCIHEDYQRKGYFEAFAAIFFEHAVRYRPKYYLALIEKKFYRMLRISFGLHLEQRGNPLPCDTTELIPVLFHMESFVPELERKWIRRQPQQQ